MVTGFKNLQVLDLSVCGINSWAQVLVLGKLPNLQELRLDGNIFPGTLSSPESFFPALQLLTLGSSG
jgi:Leucine-rich repeat (LRR) protein